MLATLLSSAAGLLPRGGPLTQGERTALTGAFAASLAAIALALWSVASSREGAVIVASAVVSLAVFGLSVSRLITAGR